MGDAYAYNAMSVVQSCIPTLYPMSNLKIDDEFHFTVVSKSEDQYFIHDEDFEEPLTVDKSFLLNPHVHLESWYRTKHFPTLVETPDDDLNIDFSIFDHVWVFSIFENDAFINESENLPVPHPGSGSDDEIPGLQSGTDSDSEHEGSSILWPISETDSEWEDNNDLPGLQSVSDSNKELEDPPPDNTSEDELTDIPDDDTMVHMSDTETETDCQKPLHGFLMLQILTLVIHYIHG